MVEVEEAIEEFLRTIRKFEEFKRVKFIILFGSAAEGNLTEDSDIDVCIYFDGSKIEGEKFRLKLLSELPDYFYVQIFNSLPIFVRKEVLKGKPIFIADRDFTYEIFYKTLEEFEDFRKYLYDYIGMRI
ncbi:MAG: nucleotidyltransferase domain-containing protein [Candidatus Aenigmatarchaeota archaeon]